MFHNFFIHSSVDGCLGCFHVLDTVNSAIMNTGVHVSFSIMAFQSVLEKEMATHWYSCLENSRDRGAWWAAIYGVAQSWT